MENLKIKVNSEAESKEAQELFFELGYIWQSGERKYLNCGLDVFYILLRENGEMSYCNVAEVDFNSKNNGYSFFKTITLPELRDLVVLKRNDVGDKTHDGVRCGSYYVTSDNTIYFYDSYWVKLACASNVEYIKKHLKPIEKTMKEYLLKSGDGKYLITKHESNGTIEIPEGAIKLVYSTTNNNHYHFVNNKNKLMSLDDINNNDGYWYGNAEEYISSLLPSVVWSRHTQPEELPFIDDKPSLNDQYAEIEKVRQSRIDETLAERQSQYGCYEDVAFVTESIMGILSKVRSNELQDLPHTHRMALYMIASKMARIVNGDFNSIDGWHDIGGYARLIEKLIEGE